MLNDSQLDAIDYGGGMTRVDQKKSEQPTDQIKLANITNLESSFEKIFISSNADKSKLFYEAISNKIKPNDDFNGKDLDNNYRYDYNNPSSYIQTVEVSDHTQPMTTNREEKKSIEKKSLRESDDVITDLNESNSKYYDYDNRPIKPMDPNMFIKQLDEYVEPTPEELAELKKKAVKARVRSKTSFDIALPQQKSFLKAKRQKSLNVASNNPMKTSHSMSDQNAKKADTIKTRPQLSAPNSASKKTKADPINNNLLSMAARHLDSPRRHVLTKTITQSNDFSQQDDLMRKSSSDSSSVKSTGSAKKKSVNNNYDTLHSQVTATTVNNKLKNNVDPFESYSTTKASKFSITDQLKQLRNHARMQKYKNHLDNVATNSPLADKNREQSAVKIQAAWRGFQARKKLVKQRSAKYEKITNELRTVKQR